jgi:hypothetical protein
MLADMGVEDHRDNPTFLSVTNDSESWSHVHEAVKLTRAYFTKFAVPKPMLEAAALCATKSQDYNAEVGRRSYFPFGAVSYSHMIHTKSQRLINLVKSGNVPNHESMRDTLLDLINYATFMAEAIDSKEI